MTGWGVAVAVVVFVMLAGMVGAALYLLLAQSVYRRGVLAGQRMAENAHRWGPSPVDVRRRGHDGWALLDRVPVEQISRPVLHD